MPLYFNKIILEKNIEYKIPYKGLESGKYQLEFQVNESFFEKFEETEIKKANLTVYITLNKKDNSLNLFFNIKGTVNIQCDRCLDFFDLPIKYNTNLFVEIGETNSDLSDAYDTITISHNENELDLSQHIFEYINLSLPYQRIHKQDKNGDLLCNRNMIEKLDSYLIKEEKKSIDPRWNKLKDIINN